MSERHVELEELAEYRVDLVVGARGGEIAQHVAACDLCRSRLNSLDAVATTLRSVPPEPMPPTVGDRISDALRRERSGAATVLPGDVPRRNRQRPWPTLAAAAAVVALIVAVTLGHVLRTGSSSTGSAASSAEGATGSPVAVSSGALAAVEHSTGTAYSAQNIVAAISGELRNPPVPIATGSAATAAPNMATQTTGVAASPIPAALRPLAQPNRLRACLALIDDTTVVTTPPISIDYATYAGKPAAVVLIPENSAHDVAYVVGPACGELRRITPASTVKTADPDLLAYQEVPTS